MSPDDSTAISSFSSPLIKIFTEILTDTTTHMESVSTSGYSNKQSFFIIMVCQSKQIRHIVNLGMLNFLLWIANYAC